MPRTTVLVVLAALLVCAALSAPEAATARDRCRVPADASGVTRGAHAIAFRAEGALFACLRTRREHQILSLDDPISTVVDAVRVAGPFVGYLTSSAPGCKETCPSGTTNPLTLEVARIGTERSRSLGDERDVGTIALSRDGVLVWTGIDRFGNGVVRLMSLGFTRRTLDVGAVDPRSLRVRGRTATWTTGDAARRARLPTR